MSVTFLLNIKAPAVLLHYPSEKISKLQSLVLLYALSKSLILLSKPVKILKEETKLKSPHRDAFLPGICKGKLTKCKASRAPALQQELQHNWERIIKGSSHDEKPRYRDEEKSPTALLSLVIAYARQVRNSKRIHDDKYTVNGHCFILKISHMWMKMYDSSSFDVTIELFSTASRSEKFVLVFQERTFVEDS
ncbi:hypothetical protein DUI87_11878 [Hirundo rustica rustica]|uniref:Uncharacterized protein n=1 Tax=Hirundo rustica rustica TaxID=333673 RepID=A0A3M0KKK2_HIRRU|nr:hypothetical protein DUI87_11878 [Hirundo rustica rustica]